VPNTALAVRGAVKLATKGGTLSPIEGWTAFEVDNNNFLSADTFSVTFAANKLPADRSLAWITSQTEIFVEIFAGIPADGLNWTAEELTSLIYGQVDALEYDPVAGTVHISGRDLTRVLIDSKTTEKWQNKTASQIAQILADRHGMKANIAATKTLAGKFYEIDHEKMTAARTEWDLLCELARNEQFYVWVSGQTLNFQPKPDPASVTPFRVTWTPPDSETGYSRSNVEALKLERALTVSKGIVVVVRSWNDAAQKTFTTTYPPNKQTAVKPGASQIGSGSQTYYYSVPNLTQEKVLQFAQAKYAQIIQHEMRCEFTIPAAGNDALTVASLVQLVGTGTAFDQTYYPDSLRRALSFDSGYTLTVSAKNHSPDTQELT
jgi:phage protein D